MIGDEPAGGTPEEFAEMIRRDSAQVGGGRAALGREDRLSGLVIRCRRIALIWNGQRSDNRAAGRGASMYLKTLGSVFTAAIVFVAAQAGAQQIYKCQDAAGKVTYASQRL